MDASLDWKPIWANYLVNNISESNRSTAHDLIVQLLEANEKGDSCIEVSPDMVEPLEGLLSTEQLNKPFIFDGVGLYLNRHYTLELVLAAQIKKLLSVPPTTTIDSSAYDHLLSDEHQVNALRIALSKNLSIITGGPGTGKTYTLARIITSLDNALKTPRIAMAAPTGKAAQRMQEALQGAFLDNSLIEQNLISENVKKIVPVTLHRLLGIGQTGQPLYNNQKKLPFDIIVIDEVSMLDLQLATMFFDAVPTHAKVILLGDANQLASVDVGYVLADLLNTNLLKENIVNLVKSRRFSDDAMIGKVAKYIQQDHTGLAPTSLISEFEKIVPPSQIAHIVPESIGVDTVQMQYLENDKLTSHLEALYLGYSQFINSLLSYRTPDQVSDVIAAFDQYRILTSTRHGGLGVNSINSYIENKINVQLFGRNKVSDWYLGRPVMITVNNYQLGLSNGDIGVCFNHRTESGQFEVYFPSSQKWISANRLPSTIETAFALTIHKSQGSEFNHVAVILDDGTEKMLSQELIYTGITRAKKIVSILTTPQNLAKAITTKTKRQSGLVRKFDEEVT